MKHVLMYSVCNIYIFDNNFIICQPVLYSCIIKTKNGYLYTCILLYQFVPNIALGRSFMVHWDSCILRNHSKGRDKEMRSVITRKLVVLINSHWYDFVYR